MCPEGARAARFLIGRRCLVGDMCHAESGTAAYLEDPLPYVSRSQLWFPLMVGAGRLGPLLLLPWFGSGT